jgi:hypothetical protein
MNKKSTIRLNPKVEGLHWLSFLRAAEADHTGATDP